MPVVTLQYWVISDSSEDRAMAGHARSREACLRAGTLGRVFRKDQLDAILPSRCW